MPRLRVFAGPNGSGKSTIKETLSPALIKTYVNADELEKEAKTTGFVDLSAFGLNPALSELLAFHDEHSAFREEDIPWPPRK